MPVIRINAAGTTPVLHNGSEDWRMMLERTDPGVGPVIAMIHGFRYVPDGSPRCPHESILARQDECPDQSPSWLSPLGFSGGCAEEGLGIAFGWAARGTIWAAQRRAGEAGRALAQVLKAVQRRHPTRPIHLIGHSLGIELCNEALHHLSHGSIGRILSLTGASYQGRVLDALQTPAGRTAEFFNVTSRENDLFDAMFEWMIAPSRRGDRGLGQRIHAPNAVNLQIDCPATLDHLRRIGHPIAPPSQRVCHWSSYTRPGILDLYNALLRAPEAYSLDLLRSGVPRTASPRWFRLLAVPGLGKLSAFKPARGPSSAL